MAKPDATHAIEVETGTGEPASIPLTLGQELQPISVGKKGMWRVDGERVLDVHAFVYFDGTSLFLQSADDKAAALVDGFRVGKTWTELHPPCRIEIGGAHLRYRSLADDDAPPSEEKTVAHVRPPVQAPPAPKTQPHPRTSSPPMTFPKPERPFAPGALASRADEDESTRVAPLERSSARSLGTSGSLAAVPAPRPAAGRPVEEDLSTRHEGAMARGQGGGMPPAAMTGPFQPVSFGGPDPNAPMPDTAMPPVIVQGVAPIGAQPGGPPPGSFAPPGYPPHQAGFAPPQQGFGPPGMPPPGMQPQGFGPHGFPPQGQAGFPEDPMGRSGGFGPGPQGSFPPQMPGGYGTPPQTAQDTASNKKIQSFSEVMKDPSARKRLLAFGVVLLGGAYLLLMDDEPEIPQEVAAEIDAGPEASVVAQDGDAAMDPTADAAIASTGDAALAPTGEASAAVATSPCPPGFKPYGEIKPGSPITCVPSADDAGASAVASSSTPDEPSATSSKPTSEPTSSKVAGKKKMSLERQAVDYVASGDYDKAADAYAELSRQFPDNQVYKEALRILRVKLDGGAP